MNRFSSFFPIAVFSVICCIPSTGLAQSKPYSLPLHKGAMLLDLGEFHVTQMSAKSEGREIGVRAHDAGHTELLAFLFVTPQKDQTAATCLEQDVKEIRKGNVKFTERLNPFSTDTGDTATVALTYASGSQVLYKYAGTGDQCLVIQIYADKDTPLDLAQASALLNRQRYDPGYVPSPDDAARYNSIEGAHIENSAAPPAVAPKMLVTWYGLGGIPLPSDPKWHPTLLTAYNNASQPDAEFKNTATGVITSFLMIENKSGTPTAEGCRNDVIAGIRKSDSGPLLSNETEGEMADGHGGKFATASHFTYISATSHNHDVFAFAGDKKVCAWVHVSTVSGKPDEEASLAEALKEFHPDLAYHPQADDYFQLATAFYQQAPLMGAPYYDDYLKTLSPEIADPEGITRRRIAADNVVIALEMAGNFDRSRGYAERAIKLDPDYPLNYYYLACADAEEFKTSSAKAHLQQAFDRRANMVPGEKMPDPTTDASFLKLKSDTKFWAFIQSLPRN